jgi:hypothetical protein
MVLKRSVSAFVLAGEAVREPALEHRVRDGCGSPIAHEGSALVPALRWPEERRGAAERELVDSLRIPKRERQAHRAAE